VPLYACNCSHTSFVSESLRRTSSHLRCFGAMNGSRLVRIAARVSALSRHLKKAPNSISLPTPTSTDSCNRTLPSGTVSHSSSSATPPTSRSYINHVVTPDRPQSKFPEAPTASLSLILVWLRSDVFLISLSHGVGRSDVKRMSNTGPSGRPISRRRKR
jgi:hypothetical protein